MMDAAPLWTITDAAQAMDARVVGGGPGPVTGVSIDTRTLEPGALFVAIRGEARDGHDFVAAALAKGASAAIVAQDREADLAGHGALLAVREPLAAMEALGRAARARSRARIVAVTGSVGKTGTKEALRHVLGAQGPTHASAASYNNHWGVPLTLARMPAGARFGVFEIGMNHPGEILPLTAMVRPHVALVTTIAPVHIEHFASLDAIADAKGELFAGLEVGGTAIVNADQPHAARLKGHALASTAGRVVTFGEGEGADVRLRSIMLGDDGSEIEAAIFGRPIAYRLGSPGRHLAMNSLAVLAAVHALGADVEAAALALAEVRPPIGRGERIVLRAPGGAFTLVDESYNANPASMRAALDNLGRAPTGQGGRRIAVLGDMLELGAHGAEMHRGLAPAVEEAGVDLVFAAGPLMRAMWDALPAGRRGAYASSAQALEPELLDAVGAGDVVMVKGSLGSRMGPIVKAAQARYGAAAPADGR